jgi:branched-subunit amino acid aminotransferase/4-amino-4-deoxychorismate lyase
VRTEVRRVRLEELHDADEIMITSSRRLASAVVRLDGRPVGRTDGGDAHAGPVARRVFEAMRAAIERGMRREGSPARTPLPTDPIASTAR